jgi:hypothetical protein
LRPALEDRTGCSSERTDCASAPFWAQS